MARHLWSATLLLMVSIGASSAESVIGVLPATNGAWGLEYHDGSLWVGDDGDGYIFRVDPDDGSVLETLPTPYDQDHIAFGANHGVTWDGTGFWVAGDFGKDWLYKVDMTGAFMDTIPAPTDAVGGLGWDGTYLLVTTYYPNNEAGILKVDPADGSIIGPTIPAQGQQPFGIVYDTSDGTLWNGMDDNDGDPEKIWNLAYSDGSVISSFDTPAVSPKGIALGDGYMWVVANTIGGAGRRIYKIDLSGAGTPDITALPAIQDFGIVALGSTGTLEQILRNDGDGDLAITDIVAVDPFSFDPQSLPEILGPSEELIFDVHFDPVVAGNFQGILRVLSNDFDEGIVDVVLLGTGVYPDPTIVISPPALNYANTGVGLVRGLTFSIENVGFADLEVTGIESSRGVFNLPPDLSLPQILETFETMDVQVVFAPEGLGAHDGTITVESNDPDDPSVDVPASGQGIDASFLPGEPIWQAQGIENVVTVLAVPDVTGDGIPDAVMESYDAGADGDPFQSFYGNSHGIGVGVWSTGDGGSGGWGDLCLELAGDLTGDGEAEIVRGTAWGGRRVEVRHSTDGGLVWSYDTHLDGGGGWVYDVDVMPDVSGDDVPEVIAGAGTDGGAGTGARRLYCFDGATGAVRFAYVSIDAFLSVAWIEDVDSDDVPDVLGGAGGNSADDRVYCVSGASVGAGVPIWEFATGGSVYSLDVIEDVNGDGFDDVLAGSWSNSVYCLDGTTGGVLWQRNVGGDVLRVEAIDDVTGDGRQDVVVARIGSSVYCLDGIDGTVHWNFPTGGNVWSASFIPDVSGDGVIDVIAGCQDHFVYCIDGADGIELWSRGVGALVYSVRYIDDVSGNGAPDVLAGTQYLGAGGGKLWCLEGGAAVSGVGEPPAGASTIRFAGVSPNPMREGGAFLFQVGAGAAGSLGVDIYDLGGRRVRRLDLDAVSGAQRLAWDGRSADGTRLASGVYYYQLRSRGSAAVEGAASGKVLLLR